MPLQIHYRRITMGRGGEQKTDSGGEQKTDSGGEQKTDSGGEQKTDSGGEQKTDSGGEQKTDSGGEQKTDSGGEQKTDSGGYRYTELVAPVFAGFSLPAIITFASGSYPGAPWHNIILSLLVTATSLFIASIGLMTTPITKEWPEKAGALRGLLCGIGICVVAGALFTLGLPAINQWWAPLVLSPLLIGSIVPALISLEVVRRHHQRSALRPARAVVCPAPLLPGDSGKSDDHNEPRPTA